MALIETRELHKSYRMGDTVVLATVVGEGAGVDLL